MSLEIITAILALHFLGDFILQSDWMAQGKSSRFGINTPMLTHISVYSLCLMPLGIGFGLLNGVIHWVTDAVTSNMTGKLWLAGKRHWFFVVIGADQLAHYLVLFWTYGKI
jgi:hypothetical protein